LATLVNSFSALGRATTAAPPLLADVARRPPAPSPPPEHPLLDLGTIAAARRPPASLPLEPAYASSSPVAPVARVAISPSPVVVVVMTVTLSSSCR
jgi:hypothetical protein